MFIIITYLPALVDLPNWHTRETLTRL